jgi:hypothetical protein
MLAIAPARNRVPRTDDTCRLCAYVPRARVPGELLSCDEHPTSIEKVDDGHVEGIKGLL